MVERNWRLFSETSAHERMGWSVGEAASRFAALIREAVTPEAQAALMDTRREVDVTDLLSEIYVPTLILHRETAWTRLADSQRLASAIPNSTLVILAGDSLAPYLGNTDEVLDAISEFVGGQAIKHSHRSRSTGAFRTVLFTDLVGHTEMMSRLGDERGRDVLREHERITREVLKANGGTEVKTMGDGFMASFGSVTKAVECAIALQRAFADREGEPLIASASASTPASPSRKTATSSARRSSWPRASRRRRTAARSWWRTRCAGCAAARASSSRTAASSWPRDSRSRCASPKSAGVLEREGALLSNRGRRWHRICHGRQR